MHPTLSPSLPSAAAEPVRPEERLLTLDVLRGMALLGVLVVNAGFWFNGQFLRMADFRPELARLTPDSAVFHLVQVFLSGRAISIFSFLFGLGLALQMMRADARGADVAPLFRRRLAILLAMGVTHGVLLWYGDILAIYALLGLLLLLFRERRDTTLLAWAAVMLVAMPLAYTAWTVLGGGPGAPSEAARAAAAARNAAWLDALQSADPRRTIPVNVAWIRRVYGGPFALAFVPAVFGCFLLGLWAGRRRFLEQVPAHAAAFRRVMVWGLGVGLATSVTLELLQVKGWGSGIPWMPLVMSALLILAVTPLAAGYLATIVLLLERPAWRARLAVFAPVGRMALTNYLAQTVICLTVYYGGGLVAYVGTAATLGISLAIYAVEMAWSPWWLARYHFGPMEWVWRSLTYGRVQPMRIRSAAVRPGLAA